MAIGATRDSPELLRKMADYLEDASGDGCCVADGLQLVFQVKKGKLKWQKA
jgi:hypothetical protein